MEISLRRLNATIPAGVSFVWSTSPADELRAALALLPARGPQSLRAIRAKYGEPSGACVDTEKQELVALSFSGRNFELGAQWVDFRTPEQIARAMYPEIDFPELVSDFIEALFFTCPEIEPGPGEFSAGNLPDRLTKAARASIVADVLAFLTACKAAHIENPEDYQSEKNKARGDRKPTLGYDLAFTAGGHGVGFWEESETIETSRTIEDEDKAGRLNRCAATAAGKQIFKTGRGWFCYE